MDRAEQINTREHARLMTESMDAQALAHELCAKAAAWLPNATPAHRARLAEQRNRHAAEAREVAAEFRAIAINATTREAA